MNNDKVLILLLAYGFVLYLVVIVNAYLTY